MTIIFSDFEEVEIGEVYRIRGVDLKDNFYLVIKVEHDCNKVHMHNILGPPRRGSDWDYLDTFNKIFQKVEWKPTN